MIEHRHDTTQVYIGGTPAKQEITSPVPKRHQGWIVRLTTGEIVWETDSDTVSPGELSSWQRLVERTHKFNERIVALSMRRGGVVLNTLSNAESYYQAREIAISANGKGKRMKQGIGAVIGDYIFINWVDDYGNVEAEYRPLIKEYIHTTARSATDILSFGRNRNTSQTNGK